MTKTQKKYATWAAAGIGAYLVYRWWNKQDAAVAAPTPLAGPVWVSPRQGPRVTRQAIPAGIPLNEWQTQHGPTGPTGVSSALVTPHYLGYGSTF